MKTKHLYEAPSMRVNHLKAADHLMQLATLSDLGEPAPQRRTGDVATD